jgi:hypothetical protein
MLLVALFSLVMLRRYRAGPVRGSRPGCWPAEAKEAGSAAVPRRRCAGWNAWPGRRKDELSGTGQRRPDAAANILPRLVDTGFAKPNNDGIRKAAIFGQPDREPLIWCWNTWTLGRPTLRQTMVSWAPSIPKSNGGSWRVRASGR